jgi:2-iminobutanoate/2-iminopropanoate deaminase
MRSPASIVACATITHLMCGCGAQQVEQRFMPARGAIGPYSGSVIAGDLCFVSGKIAPESAAGGAFADEVSAAIDAVRDELATSGLTMGDIVSVTAYLTDMSQFAEFNRIYVERFAQPYPARTTVGVASLPAGRRVEITVVALRRNG